MPSTASGADGACKRREPFPEGTSEASARKLLTRPGTNTPSRTQKKMPSTASGADVRLQVPGTLPGGDIGSVGAQAPDATRYEHALQDPEKNAEYREHWSPHEAITSGIDTTPEVPTNPESRRYRAEALRAAIDNLNVADRRITRWLKSAQHREVSDGVEFSPMQFQETIEALQDNDLWARLFQEYGLANSETAKAAVTNLIECFALVKTDRLKADSFRLLRVPSEPSVVRLGSSTLDLSPTIMRTSARRQPSGSAGRWRLVLLPQLPQSVLVEVHLVPESSLLR